MVLLLFQADAERQIHECNYLSFGPAPHGFPSESSLAIVVLHILIHSYPRPAPHLATSNNIIMSDKCMHPLLSHIITDAHSKLRIH